MMAQDRRKKPFWVLALGLFGCQLISGASERTLVSSCEGGDCACRPGAMRCLGAVRQTCDVNGVYADDLCPEQMRYCTGEGECVACLTADDCNVQNPDCNRPVCTADHRCTSMPEPSGHVPALQAKGDCLRRVCDGNGNAVSEVFEDPPDDNNACTEDRCEGAVPKNSTLADGTPCVGGICRDGTCVGPCNNGLPDGDETDVDCGGFVCAARCEEDQSCRRGRDCESKYCSTCEDSFHCSVCTGECTGGTCGLPPLIVYNTRCYGVAVLRDGVLIGSQSSPTLCETADRRLRPRPGDVVFVYVRYPDLNTMLVTSTSTSDAIYPKEWYFRCENEFQTPQQLAPRLRDDTGFERGTAAIMSAYCLTAALYKWVVEP